MEQNFSLENKPTLSYSTCTGLEDTYFLYQCLKILTQLPPISNTTKISSQQ